MDKQYINNLISEIQKGNEVAFEKLFETTNKSLFSFVYLIVKNRADAEDVVQETFIKIKRSIQSFNTKTNPTAWMFQIAKHSAFDHMKKKLECVDCSQVEIASLDNSTLNKANKMYIHDLMNKYLDVEARQIVILHVLAGYKHREIAKLLSLSLGTTLWKYNTALKILKEKIKEDLR